jgi:hypothetical protein
VQGKGGWTFVEAVLWREQLRVKRRLIAFREVHRIDFEVVDAERSRASATIGAEKSAAYPSVPAAT